MMKVSLAHVGVGAMVLGIGACSASAQEVMRWQVEGETREAIVYAPPAPPDDERLPVVLSFHGSGDNMQNFQYTDVHVAWPEAIVVYFQGLPDSGLARWQAGRGVNNDRDLKLVDVALAWLRETYSVDDDRIYATGFSNGGMFTYLLWAERPGVFAAYAPVAGRLRQSVQPTQPRPIFHVAGRRDRQVEFSDQEAAIANAVEVNGVGADSTVCGDGCTVYGPETAAPVRSWIHPGGHVYPRDTSARIVSFFRDHRHTP
jgi:polyhydroxybutyrate depolymerase